MAKRNIAIGPLLALACSLSAGCAPIRDSVRSQAAAELECSPAETTVAYTTGGIYDVTACGVRAKYRCERDRLGNTRCARLGDPKRLPGSIRKSTVRAKAARFLQCTGPLEVAPKQDGDYLASGCGRSIKYECVSHPDCCAYTVPGAQAASDDADPSAASARAVSPDASGSLSKEVIRRVIATAASDVRTCYEAALSAAPYPAGVVAVKFIIAPTGHVQVAAIAESSLTRSDVEACITTAIRGLRFPPPNGGGIVVVTYPYVLETNGIIAECP